jgi:MFS family permease
MGPERAAGAIPRAVPGAARRAIATIFLVDGAVVGTWAARVPALQDRAGVSTATLGLALAGLAAGALVAMPISGWRAARDGSRRTTLVCVAAIVIALPIPSLATSAAGLILGAVALGAANGAIDVAMNAHGVEVERRLGRPILSSLHAFWSIGAFAGAGVTALMTATGVPAELHLVAASALLGAIGLFACSRLMPSAEHPAEGSAGRRTRPSRRVLGLTLIALSAFLAEGAINDWGALYLRTSLGESATIGAAGYAVFVGSMALMRLTGDRLIAHAGRTPIVRVGTALGGGALALALLAEHPAAAFAAFACLGIGLANVFPLVVSAASRSPAPGVAIATVTTGGYAGVLIGPPAIGFLADASSLPASLGVVVALCALMVALAGLVRTGPATPT